MSVEVSARTANPPAVPPTPRSTARTRLVVARATQDGNTGGLESRPARPRRGTRAPGLDQRSRDADRSAITRVGAGSTRCQETLPSAIRRTARRRAGNGRAGDARCGEWHSAVSPGTSYYRLPLG